MAQYREICQIPNFRADLLMISDILVSGTITPVPPSQKFRKEDIGYSPHMFNAFYPGEIVGLFRNL